MVLVAMTWVVCTGVVEYKVDGGGGGAGSVRGTMMKMVATTMAWWSHNESK